MNTPAQSPKATSQPTEAAKGLVLFSRHDGPAKRRRQIFAAIYILAAALLVWPVFPVFSGFRPLIFGLPLSFAWVVMALLLMFGALIWLFRSEDHDESAAEAP